MSDLLPIEEPATRPRPPFALWQLGFRPFYLLAATFGALSALAWGLQMSGHLGATYLPDPLWHAHEMLFGFALPVIVGFLFTAGRNWTGLPTPTGGRLAALAGLWLAGRVLVLAPWPLASALANAAFPLAASIALAVPFVRARNRRNYFFLALLAAFSVATLAVHLHAMGMLRVPGWAGIGLALDVVLFVLAVMAGRVVPMFTNNGIPGTNARRNGAIEKAALGGLLALLAADAVQAPIGAIAALAAFAAVAHLARWVLWQPWRTLRTPLVWVLHAGYAWLWIHLAMRAAAGVGALAPSLATHALTTGALGLLVIGMMTRTSRGHTARPLRADAWDTACYLLVAGAAIARVLVPLFAPAVTTSAWLAAALSWAAGFGLFALRYAPVLARPRLDGKPG